MVIKSSEVLSVIATLSDEEKLQVGGRGLVNFGGWPSLNCLHSTPLYGPRLLFVPTAGDCPGVRQRKPPSRWRVRPRRTPPRAGGAGRRGNTRRWKLLAALTDFEWHGHSDCMILQAASPPPRQTSSSPSPKSSSARCRRTCRECWSEASEASSTNWKPRTPSSCSELCKEHQVVVESLDPHPKRKIMMRWHRFRCESQAGRRDHELFPRRTQHVHFAGRLGPGRYALIRLWNGCGYYFWLLNCFINILTRHSLTYTVFTHVSDVFLGGEEDGHVVSKYIYICKLCTRSRHESKWRNKLSVSLEK